MHYIDTNVLVYAYVNQDEHKMKTSQALITELVEKQEFALSPLSLQELTFTLSKLKVDIKTISYIYNLLNNYCCCQIDKSSIDQAVHLCAEIESFKSINDAVHLALAEKYCHAFSTFDQGFKAFQKNSSIPINIL